MSLYLGDFHPPFPGCQSQAKDYIYFLRGSIWTINLHLTLANGKKIRHPSTLHSNGTSKSWCGFRPVPCIPSASFFLTGTPEHLQFAETLAVFKSDIQFAYILSYTRKAHPFFFTLAIPSFPPIPSLDFIALTKAKTSDTSTDSQFQSWEANWAKAGFAHTPCGCHKALLKGGV